MKKSENTEKTEITSLVDADYNRKKLFKKGVNLMADEKLEDAVEVFEQALRIDPGNIEKLANTVIQLLKDEIYAAKLGSNGRQRIEKEFRWETRAQKFKALLSKI